MVAFIDKHRDRWPVIAMCTAIEVPERSYYAAKARPASARSVSDAVHRVHIRRVWENNYRCYGARRVHKQLHREGYTVARCTGRRASWPVVGRRPDLRLDLAGMAVRVVHPRPVQPRHRGLAEVCLTSPAASA